MTNVEARRLASKLQIGLYLEQIPHLHIAVPLCDSLARAVVETLITMKTMEAVAKGYLSYK